MTPAKRRNYRYVIRNAALVVVSIVILILILEIVFRTTHVFGARISWREPDPILGWRSIPNSSYWYIKENDHPVSGKVNLDSVLSIVQMPPGIPVAAVGLDRGDNAALLAAEMLAISDENIARRLKEHRAKQEEKVKSDASSYEGS